MKARLIKPVKYDLSSCSSVFTPISSISKTEISGKILPDTGYYRIVEFYRILVSGSGTSLTCTWIHNLTEIDSFPDSVYSLSQFREIYY